MKILGLDSSGLVASAAVVDGDELIAEYTTNYKKTHSQTLLPMLEELRNMIELDLWGTDRIVCPLMDARRNQVYTAAYEFVQEGEGFRLHTLIGQSPMDIREILEKLMQLGRPVTFLGDGVPVYLNVIRGQTGLEYAIAPAGNNRQRAACIAALGAVYFAQGRTVSAADHHPEYLRTSQAEREAAGRRGHPEESL